MGSQPGVKRGPYRPHLYTKYGGTADPLPEAPKPEQPKRHVHPNTSDRPYEDAEREFIMAMDTYKRASGHMFPQWSEVLGVLVGLGYHK